MCVLGCVWVCRLGSPGLGLWAGVYCGLGSAVAWAVLWAGVCCVLGCAVGGGLLTIP